MFTSWNACRHFYIIVCITYSVLLTTFETMKHTEGVSSFSLESSRIEQTLKPWGYSKLSVTEATKKMLYVDRLCVLHIFISSCFCYFVYRPIFMSISFDCNKVFIKNENIIPNIAVSIICFEIELTIQVRTTNLNDIKLVINTIHLPPTGMRNQNTRSASVIGFTMLYLSFTFHQYVKGCRKMNTCMYTLKAREENVVVFKNPRQITYTLCS